MSLKDILLQEEFLFEDEQMLFEYKKGTFPSVQWTNQMEIDAMKKYEHAKNAEKIARGIHKQAKGSMKELNRKLKEDPNSVPPEKVEEAKKKYEDIKNHHDETKRDRSFAAYYKSNSYKRDLAKGKIPFE